VTMVINHSFVSTKPVGTDASRIYSDSWNANHTITGTADATQLNPNVVQVVVSDTNVTGSIAAQTLTLSWSGTLSAARGGFGANISAQSGVPLFASGVPTFTGTTGTGNFVRATSPTLVTPVLGVASGTSLSLSGFLSMAMGSDNINFLNLTGAGGNGRLVGTIDASSNVLLRTPLATSLILGTNSTSYLTIGPTGTITLAGPLNYGGVTLNNAVTGTGNMVLSNGPAITLGNATGLPIGGLSATGTPSSSTFLRGDNTWATPVATAVLRSYLAGLTLSTAGSSSSFGIAVGVAADSTTTSMMALTSAYAKTTSSWAVGSGNGALDTGTIVASAWYHVFLIQRTDTGVVDVLISLSATSPTLPSPYTLFRRIGSLCTSASQWIKFTQLGDEFLWDVSQANLNGSPGDTLAHALAVTVPTSVQVTAILAVGAIAGSGADGRFVLSEFDKSDEAPAISNLNAGVQGSTTLQGFQRFLIRTNTSAQIRYRAFNATGQLIVNTSGWIDTRGKLL